MSDLFQSEDLADNREHRERMEKRIAEIEGAKRIDRDQRDRMQSIIGRLCDEKSELEAERDRLLRNAPAVMGWVSANVKDNGWADINKAMQMLEEKS
jgi:hypothetical protein